MRTKTCLLTASLGAALALSGCAAGPRHVEADYAVHDTVARLSATSDAVVVGRIGDVVSREIDGGGDDETQPGAGLPMAFYRVDVTRSLAGGAPRSVVVAWPDPDQVRMEGATPVRKSQQLLLFLEHVGPGEAPGVTSVGEFYVPVSGDNGVFDVSSRGAVAARSDAVRGLTRAALRSNARAFSAQLIDVENAVRHKRRQAPSGG